MTGQMLLLLATFLLGCIVTEIRWIGRMRELRGLRGIREAAKMHEGESVALPAAADAGAHGRLSGEETQQSLRSLRQHLTDDTPASPIPETTTKS